MPRNIQEQKSDHTALHHTRRKFFKISTALTAVALIPSEILKAAEDNIDEIKVFAIV